MDYSIKAHETRYSGVQFRSRLEARWAAFFDLASWKWQYEPFDLEEWTPDFWVEFHCGHSECPPTHELLVEVKPYISIQQFAGHPCLYYDWGFHADTQKPIPADASAAFGNDPSVTRWVMAHGAGGGNETIEDWVEGDVMELWKEAGNRVRWNPRFVSRVVRGRQTHPKDGV